MNQELYQSPEERTLARLEGEGWLCALSDQRLYIQGRYRLAVGGQTVEREGVLELEPGDVLGLSLKSSRNRWLPLAAMLFALLGVLLRISPSPASSALFRAAVLCLGLSLAAIPLQRLFRRRWVEVESWRGRILLPARQLDQEALQSLQSRLEGLKTFRLRQQAQAAAATRSSTDLATRAAGAAMAAPLRAGQDGATDMPP